MTVPDPADAIPVVAEEASPRFLYPQSSGADGLERLRRAWAFPSRFGFFTETNNTWIGQLYVATLAAYLESLK